MKLILYFLMLVHVFARAHMQIHDDVGFQANVTINGTLTLGSATLTQDKLNKLLNILEIIENNATKQCLRTLYNTLSEC